MTTHTVGPRGLTPGTPEYIELNLSSARTYAQFVERDARPLIERCQELYAVRVWESWFSEPPRTWDRFCREAIGYEATFIQRIAEGIKLLEASGHVGPIGAYAALHANGGDRRSKGFQCHTYDTETSIVQRGDDVRYRLARLRRDAPTIAAAYDRGEYANVKAACAAAGIPYTAKVTHAKNVAAYARSARTHLTPAEIAELIAALEQERA